MKVSLNKEFYYRVTQQDDFYSICKYFNTSKENIERNNHTIPLYAGEWVKIKVNDYISHIVKPAETLQQISLQYNISIQSIIDYNNLLSDKLYIGQILKIKQ